MSHILFGRQIKVEYPEYATEDDEQLGLTVAQEYPQMYQNFLRHGTTKVDLHLEFKKADEDLKEIDDLDDPGLGGIAAWFRTRRAENLLAVKSRANMLRSETLGTLKIEEGIIQAKVDRALMPERTERGLEVERTVHEDALRAMERNRTLADKALEQGMSPDTYGMVVQRKAIADIERGNLSHANQEEIGKERELTDIRFKDYQQREVFNREHKKELDAIELDKRWKEIVQDLNASTIFALGHLKTAEQIRKYLSECYERLDTLEKRKSKAAQREFVILTEHVEEIEAQFRGTTRLLQGATPENTQGSDPNPKDPRNP